MHVGKEVGRIVRRRIPGGPRLPLVLACLAATGGIAWSVEGARVKATRASILDRKLEDTVARARLAYIEEPNDWWRALRYAQLQCHLLDSRQLEQACRFPYRARFAPDPELHALRHRLQDMSRTPHEAAGLAALEKVIAELESGAPPGAFE